MSSPPDSTSAVDVPAGESPPQDPPSAENLSEKLEKMNISSSSFSIWPPTQRTRDAVINRLIETLSTPSVLSKRYGSMPLDEASTTAKAIEEEAYNTAAATGGSTENTTTSVDEGLEILQVYSKEISKRMLEAVKSKAATDTAATATASTDAAADGAVVATEEVSSVDNENESSS